MTQPPKSVAVLIPVHGSVPAKSFASITSMLLSSGKKIPMTTIFLESSMLFESRNMLLKEFLKTNAQYAFFLDSDMVMQNNLIEKLLEQEKDVVSSLAFTRTMPPMPAIRKKTSEGYKAIEDYPKDSLIEVDAVGLYSMLLKREVVEKIFTQTNGTFIPVEKNQFNETKGEDIIFCENIKKSGYKIHVHTGIKIGHYGGIIFPR